tara:strand:+ start:503 stop:772 length:270 start_codon:yes stop_codon:yes gene_type:complete
MIKSVCFLFGLILLFPELTEEGMNERRKVADLTKTLGTMSPDKNAVMFKIAVYDKDGLKSFVDGSNPVSKPIWYEVMESYEIFELNKVS